MKAHTALLALFAATMTTACVEEGDTSANRSDVTEKRGARETVVDAFAEGLCTGDALDAAGLRDRFGSDRFGITVQLASRTRACRDGKCDAWWEPEALATVDATFDARDGRVGYELGLDRTWAAVADGVHGEGRYENLFVAAFDEVAGGLVGVEATMTDALTYSFGPQYGYVIGTESATTTLDASCTRSIVRMEAPPTKTGEPSFQVEYAVYASLRVEPTPELRITEVDYDQPGSDTAEFVEIENVGDATAGLVRMELQLIDGKTDEAYLVIDLAEATAALEPGRKILVGAKSLADAAGDAAYLKLGASLQNGPDAVRIVDAISGEIVDEVRYGAPAEQLADGTTRPSPTDAGKGSLCRQDGVITSCATPTPGR